MEKTSSVKKDTKLKEKSNEEIQSTGGLNEKNQSNKTMAEQVPNDEVKEKEKDMMDSLKDTAEESEEEEEKPIYKPIDKNKEVGFTFLSANSYFHYKYRYINQYIRYILDSFIVSLFLLGPLYLVALFSEKIEINYDSLMDPKKLEGFDGTFKKLFCFSIVYTIFSIIFILSENIFLYIYKLIFFLGNEKNDKFWGAALTIHNERVYLRRFCSFTMTFLILTGMYGDYQRTDFSFRLDINTIKTFILWLSIYNGSLFLIRFLINMFVNKIKVSGYQSKIRDINYKSFIFKMIFDSATNSEDDIVSNVIDINDGDGEILNNDDNKSTQLDNYDPGFYLKYKNLFKNKDETIQLLENTFALLSKTTLNYDDIKEIFPDNYENVFLYLSGETEIIENKKLKPKELKKVLISLYDNRKNTQKSLKDRDKIFDLLNDIFTAFVSIVDSFVLLFLFKIDYKFFLSTIGSFTISFTWIFSDSIKEIYTCFLFLLYIRPYDIGDFIIYNFENYTVSTIDLFNTTFLTDSQVKTYIPHIILIKKDIKNISRSKSLNLILQVGVSTDTTYANATNLVDNVNRRLKKDSKIYNNCSIYELNVGELILNFEGTNILSNKNEIESSRRKIVRLLEKILESSSVKPTNGYTIKNKIL